jgi:succinyl-diaminopimelate desuccinylase
MTLCRLAALARRVPSLIGEERALATRWSCDPRAPAAVLCVRYGDSLVVPVTRGSGGPHVVLVRPLRRRAHRARRTAAHRRRPLYAPGAADMKSGLT